MKDLVKFVAMLIKLILKMNLDNLLSNSPTSLLVTTLSLIQIMKTMLQFLAVVKDKA